MPDPAFNPPTRPLKMRNLRAGRTSSPTRAAEPETPPVTSGVVDSIDEWHRALDHAVEERKVSDANVAVFTISLRRLDLTRRSETTPRPNETDMAALATSIATSIDPRLVLHIIAPDELIGFMGGSGRVEAERVMGRLLAGLSGILTGGPETLALAPQLGAAFLGGNITNGELAVEAANVTLTQTTRAAPFLIYNDYVHQRIVRELQTRDALPDAVAANDISLAFEPRGTTGGDRVVGIEAFARWEHSKLGTIPPPEFLRIADELDLMVEMGHRLRDRAAGAAVTWFRDGWLSEGTLWLNVSYSEFCHRGFAGSLGELRNRYPEVKLGIEIDDSPLLDEAVVTSMLEPVRKLDVEIALDNIGLTTISLGRLQRLPLSSINLSGAIVHSLVSDTVYQHLATTVCEIAHSRGIVVTACQAETREQLAAARSLGIDHIQGHVLAAPVKASSVTDLLASGIAPDERRGRR